MSDKEVRKLKPEVEELSSKLLEGIQFNKAESSISETKGNYVENLPEGVSQEVDEKITKYRENFVAASAHAAGQLAVKSFVDHKKISRIDAEFKMGKNDVVRHSTTRSKVYTGIGAAADRPPTEKFGVVSTEVDIKGGRTGSGQLKIARELVGHLASEALKK